MSKKFHNIFSQIFSYEQQIVDLEKRIENLEDKITDMIKIERNHLIRIKNHEELSDDFIASGRKYYDMSPEKAWRLYNDKNFDFVLIDVSSRDFEPERKIPEALYIPWNEFHTRFFEVQTKTTPIFIICEDGTKSILACDFMVRHGYFNCNNISGGYLHWKGFQLKDVKGISA